QHGADWDSYQNVIRDRVPIKACNALVFQDRAGRRQRGDQEPSDGDTSGEPSRTSARPPGLWSEPKVRGRQAARSGRRQRGTGGTEVDEDVSPVMPRLLADDVVVCSEGGTSGNGEPYVPWPATAHRTMGHRGLGRSKDFHLSHSIGGQHRFWNCSWQ